MPREDEQETMSGGKQSPEPGNESSQSPEPGSEVRDSSENRESSLELPTEEASFVAQSPRDSAASGSVSEESVCSKCGGKKIKSDLDLEPLRKSNSDGDLPKSTSSGDLGTLPQSRSDGALQPLPESQLICKCGPDQVKSEDESKTSMKNDAGAGDTEKTEAENRSPVVQEESANRELTDHSVQETASGTSGTVSEKKALEESSTKKSPDKELSIDSVKSASSTSDSVSEKENDAESQETVETKVENQSLNAFKESSTEKSPDQDLSRDSEEENRRPSGSVSEMEKARRIEETAAENQPLTASKESPSTPDQGQELSSDSVEESSGSTTSDSPSENFAIITYVRPPPRSPAGMVQQRRRCGSPLDEVNIPIERYRLLDAATGEIVPVGDNGSSARGGSPQLQLVLPQSNVRNRTNESRASVTSTEYKSMLKVIGCVILLVFTIVFALLLAAQISFNRRFGFDSTKDLDRNSTAEDE